ncbi:MAG: TM2 domain-containing protein [Verrucomicrobiales bacterium]|nr:TM2 domain-containing protein [Verrucomicrobiales bacterium]
MYCSKCGTPNDDTARFCAKCGTPLAGAPAPGGTVAPPPIDPRVRGGGSLPVGPGSLPPGQPTVVAGKNPWLAVLLSFLLAGLGQIYNGDTKKGLIMLVVGILVSWTIVLYVGIWIWSMIDAHSVASGKGKTW